MVWYGNGGFTGFTSFFPSRFLPTARVFSFEKTEQMRARENQGLVVRQVQGCVPFVYLSGAEIVRLASHNNNKETHQRKAKMGFGGLYGDSGDSGSGDGGSAVSYGRQFDSGIGWEPTVTFTVGDATFTQTAPDTQHRAPSHVDLPMW